MEISVFAVDDCSLGTPENRDDAVDFRDRSVLEADLPTDVDVVCHLAARSSYAMHEDNPRAGARVNVEGFVNTVEQARADGCDTIVYASSIDGSRTEPSPEDLPVTVNTGYAASKLARERYGEYVASHYDLHVAGLRFFSVYQGYGGAEAHEGEYANVIAQFADDVANGRSPTLYGDVPVNGVNGSQRVAARERSEPDRLARGPRRGTSPTSRTSFAASSWSPTTGSPASTTSAPARRTASTPSSSGSPTSSTPTSPPSTSRTPSPNRSTSTTRAPTHRRSARPPAGRPRSTSQRASGASVRRTGE